MNKLYDKNLLTIGFVISLVASVISCNKSASNSGAPPPAPPVIITCPVGQVMGNAGCVTINSAPTVPLQYFSSMNDNFNSSGATLSPGTSYTDFLQNALGVCERCANSYGEALQCSNWANGFNMIRLEFTSGITNKMRAHFYSSPIINNQFTYAWNFPTLGDFFVSFFTGAPPPSCNPGQYSPYWWGDFSVESNNGGKGFVLYGQGPYQSKWNRHVIRIYVDTGVVGDPNFTYRAVAYTPTNTVINIASGSFTRCQTLNCGLY